MTSGRPKWQCHAERAAGPGRATTGRPLPARRTRGRVSPACDCNRARPPTHRPRPLDRARAATTHEVQLERPSGSPSSPPLPVAPSGPRPGVCHTPRRPRLWLATNNARQAHPIKTLAHMRAQARRGRGPRETHRPLRLENTHHSDSGLRTARTLHSHMQRLHFTSDMAHQPPNLHKTHRLPRQRQTRPRGAGKFGEMYLCRRASLNCDGTAYPEPADII